MLEATLEERCKALKASPERKVWPYSIYDEPHNKAWTCYAWGDTRDKRVSGIKVSPEQKLRSYIVVADLGCALTPSAQPDNKAWSCYDWGCIRGKA